VASSSRSLCGTRIWRWARWFTCVSTRLCGPVPLSPAAKSSVISPPRHNSYAPPFYASSRHPSTTSSYFSAYYYSASKCRNHKNRHRCWTKKCLSSRRLSLTLRWSRRLSLLRNHGLRPSRRWGVGRAPRRTSIDPASSIGSHVSLLSHRHVPNRSRSCYRRRLHRRRSPRTSTASRNGRPGIASRPSSVCVQCRPWL